MVATFNGWDDMSEPEREGLEQWEAVYLAGTSGWAAPDRRWSGGFLTISAAGRISRISQPAG